MVKGGMRFTFPPYELMNGGIFIQLDFQISTKEEYTEPMAQQEKFLKNNRTAKIT